MATVITTGVLEQLVEIVGWPHVQTDMAARERAVFDGMRPGRAALGGVVPQALPLAVVRPASTVEVSRVLVAALAAGVPVVPYGGGTGLMGGARTVRPGIVLDLRRMDRVVEVAAADRTARAQAGVVIADLNAVFERFGNRGYRAAQLESGIIGGKMYLAAYAQGFGATGLTFYDDDVIEFFSPHAEGKSAIFQVAIGKSAARRLL